MVKCKYSVLERRVKTMAILGGLLFITGIVLGVVIFFKLPNETELLKTIENHETREAMILRGNILRRKSLRDMCYAGAALLCCSGLVLSVL